MNFDIQIFDSLTNVTCDLWNTVAQRQRIALETDHLKAFEESQFKDSAFYYILVSQNGKPIGIAHAFTITLDFSTLSDIMTPEVRTVLKTWDPHFMDLKALECGLISALGEGIEVKDESLLPAVLQDITRKLEEIAIQEGVDVIILRDIPWERHVLYLGLEKRAYFPLLGYPTTLMPVRWKSFEEYLASMKHKSRLNIKNRMAKLQADEIEVDVLYDFGEHAECLAALWEQTHQRSTEFRHERLTASYFVAINRHLPDRSHIVAIKRYGEIVAFCMCLTGDEEHFLVHLGLDYTHNEQYNLYFGVTTKAIEDAFKNGAKVLNMGLTSYDAKFAAGFEALPYVYFVKHVSEPSLSRTFANVLRDSIKQPNNTRKPFKGLDISSRVNLTERSQQLQTSLPDKKYDVFEKAFQYERANVTKFADLYTFFPMFESAQNPIVSHKGKDVIMLGSNSYLGLGTHPDVCAEAKQAIDKYGTGCSGSPFLNGTLDIHVQLARSLADFMTKDDAVLFSTGYQTNVGVVSALVDKHDILIMDRLNHASLIDGACMSQARVVRYGHNDMQALEKKLQAYPDCAKLVVVDAVFSMEGTMANLPKIVSLAKQYNARIMLDEAHGIGILGPGGRGVAEHFGVLDEIDIVMGTFSKSFASVGGFIAGDTHIIEYLRHQARSHMFSASLPPASISAVQQALQIAIDEPERRQRTIEHAQYMSDGLQKLGFRAPFHGTAIVPVYCHDELLTLGLYRKLLELGVFVNPVLHPAVPKGQEMLRTSYMATHTTDILNRALEVFEQIRTPNFPKNG